MSQPDDHHRGDWERTGERDDELKLAVQSLRDLEVEPQAGSAIRGASTFFVCQAKYARRSVTEPAARAACVEKHA